MSEFVVCAGVVLIESAALAHAGSEGDGCRSMWVLVCACGYCACPSVSISVSICLSA